MGRGKRVATFLLSVSNNWQVVPDSLLDNFHMHTLGLTGFFFFVAVGRDVYKALPE